MNQRVWILGATAAVALLLLMLQRLTARDVTRRGLEFLPEMVYSEAYESFSAHADRANGMTMQPLVPGTVVRGTARFPYQPTPGDAERAGLELANPFDAADDAARLRGGEVYRAYCTVCHDAAGTGRGPVVRRGMLPPPSLLAERARQMKDGQMFHVLTRGQGNMASYAAQITPEDRWKVILHVRTLQSEPPK